VIKQNIYTATNGSAAQPNVKENSADRYPVVQLTSQKAGTLKVIRRVQIKLKFVSPQGSSMIFLIPMELKF
jgi:hypothetical protein